MSGPTGARLRGVITAVLALVKVATGLDFVLMTRRSIATNNEMNGTRIVKVLSCPISNLVLEC